jgi:hypothetical protein
MAGFTDSSALHSRCSLANPQILRSRKMPNQSLEPTPVGRFSSAFAVDIARPAWLSSGRSAAAHIFRLNNPTTSLKNENSKTYYYVTNLCVTNRMCHTHEYIRK